MPRVSPAHSAEPPPRPSGPATRTPQHQEQRQGVNPTAPRDVLVEKRRTKIRLGRSLCLPLIRQVELDAKANTYRFGSRESLKRTHQVVSDADGLVARGV
jgi:hypothetical protein